MKHSRASGTLSKASPPPADDAITVMSDSAPSTPEPTSRTFSFQQGTPDARAHDSDLNRASFTQEACTIEDAPDTSVVSLEGETYDWASYVEPYEGRTKIDRLVHLARRVPLLRAPCLEAALDLIKQTPNVGQYQQVADLRVNTPHAPPFTPDDEWIAATSNQNQLEYSQLSHALAQARFNGVKESLRMAHRDLAELYHATGHYRPAQGHYQETREFASSVAQTLDITMGLAEMALSQLSYDNVQTLVSRAEGIVAGAAEAINKANESKLDEVLLTLSIGLTPAGELRHKRTLSGALPATSSSTSGADSLSNVHRTDGSMALDEASTPPRRTGFNQTHGAAADGGPSAKAAAKQAQATRYLRLFRDKLNVMGGIAALGLKKFQEALNRLSRVDANSASHWNYISTPSDVALYAALCAVLVLSRAEMGRRLVRREGPQSEAANEAASAAANNAEGGTATGQGITGLLEYNVPAREFLWKYYEGDFASIRSFLGDARAPLTSRLTLDLYLGHGGLFATMTDAIVTHSVRDFLQSYNFARIDDMAHALALPADIVIKKVKSLWEREEVDVRIDMVQRTFSVQVADNSNEVYQQVIEVSQERTQMQKAILLGQAMLENDLILTSF